MDYMKRNLLFFLSLSCLSQGFNLVETINLSKQNDPGYRSQVLTLDASRLNGKIAAGRLAPRIDLSFYGTNLTTDNNATSTTGDLKLSVNADIYNAIDISNYKKGKLESKEALVKLKFLDINHSVQTLNRYFETLKAYSNLKVKQFALNQYQQSYHEAHDKESVGLISSSETLVSLSNLDLAKLSLTIAKNDLDHKVSTLEGQINTPITSLNIYASLSVPELNAPPLSELTQYALSSGYKIQLANLKLKKSRNALNTAENAFAPKASVSFERTQPIHTLNDHFFESAYSSQKLYLSLSINAFSGFSDLNTLKQKRISYLSSEACLAEEQYTIKLSIEKAYRDHQNNQLQAHASLIALKSANASLKATQERYKAGHSSELEYTTAITQATNAQESFYSSVYTLMSGYLNLKASASLLEHTDITTISNYLTSEIALSPTENLS